MRKIILTIGVIFFLFQIKLSASFALVLLKSPTPPVTENTPIRMEISNNIRTNHIYKLLIYRSSSLIETKNKTPTSTDPILLDIGPYTRGTYNIDCGVYNSSNTYVESCGTFVLDIAAAAQPPKKYCCRNPQQTNWQCQEDTTGTNPACVFTSQSNCDAACKPGGTGGTGATGCASLPCDLNGSTNCATVHPKSPRQACLDCEKNNQVYTALGCVHTKPEDFVAQLLGWVIGIGGGIAFLLIVWGGFQIVTSSGNPEKLDSGKEIIVSALTGLLMIVFSVILLRIIGVDILKIPGL